MLMLVNTLKNCMTVSSVIALAGLSVFAVAPVDVEAAQITHQFTVTNNLIPRDLGNPEYVYDGVMAVCSHAEPWAGDQVTELARLNPGESMTFLVSEDNDVRKLVYFDYTVSYNLIDGCYSGFGTYLPLFDLNDYSQPHEFEVFQKAGMLILLVLLTQITRPVLKCSAVLCGT